MQPHRERKRVYLQIEALPCGQLTGVAVLDAARCVPLALRQPGARQRQTDKPYIRYVDGSVRIVYRP